MCGLSIHSVLIPKMINAILSDDRDSFNSFCVDTEVLSMTKDEYQNTFNSFCVDTDDLYTPYLNKHFVSWFLSHFPSVVIIGAPLEVVSVIRIHAQNFQK